MPYFKDQEEMRGIQHVFFDQLASDPGIGPQLRASNLILRFVTQDPDGVITIDCRGAASAGKYFTTIFGESPVRPDITLTLSSDLAHEFWLGRANIVNALFSGKAKALGDVTLAMKFLPVLKPIADIYHRVLVKLGRQDLVLK